MRHKEQGCGLDYQKVLKFLKLSDREALIFILLEKDNTFIQGMWLYAVRRQYYSHSLTRRYMRAIRKQFRTELLGLLVSTQNTYSVSIYNKVIGLMIRRMGYLMPFYQAHNYKMAKRLGVKAPSHYMPYDIRKLR